MLLRDWLTKNGLTHLEFARTIRKSKTAMGHWCTGARVPRHETIKEIDTATDGDVTYQDHLSAKREYDLRKIVNKMRKKRGDKPRLMPGEACL